MNSLEPDDEQLTEIAARAGGDEDTPVVMLNLNRYRDREAYMRYGAVAASVLQRVGGHVLWYAEAQQTVIGDGAHEYDEVIAVWYPSRAAFLQLVTDNELETVRADRMEGLERTTIICCGSGAEPVLGVGGAMG